MKFGLRRCMNWPIVVTAIGLLLMLLMLAPVRVHAVTGLETTNDLDALAENYVQFDRLQVKDAEFTSTNPDVTLMDGWKHVAVNDVFNLDKAMLYYGKLSWGSANTTKAAGAKMAANEIDGVFTFRFSNAAHVKETLTKTRDADLVITLSNWVYRVGARPSGVSASDKVYVIGAGGHRHNDSLDNGFGLYAFSPRTNYMNNETALETTCSQKMRVTISVVEPGTDTPVGESKYPTMRFGVRDLDVKDYTEASGQSDAARYAGTFAESVALKDGFMGPIYVDPATYTQIDTVDGNQRIHGTRLDSSTMKSGFAASTTPQGFSFVWRASSTAQHAVQNETAAGNGVGTKIEPYDVLLLDNVSITYEWEGDHPDVTVPDGEDEWEPGASYEVDTTYKPGDTIEADGGVWTFQGWDHTGTLVINEDTVIKGTWTFEQCYNILTEAVNGSISDPELNIPPGENRTIAYTPYTGYQLYSVTVDGVEQDPAAYPASYPFDNISADHHIKVVYEPIPALEVEKTADKKIYNAGDTVTYTVTVRQTVPDAQARCITIADTLPEGLSLDVESLEGEGITVVSASSGSYELYLESLTDEITYTYKAVTAGDADAEDLTNVVEATGENVPGDPARDDETIKSLLPKALIDKSVTNETPVCGENIMYTISVKEPQEGVVLRNAVVKDAFPEGIAYIDDSIVLSGDAATATVENGALIVNIPELAEETVIQFQALVTAKSGDVDNIAVLTGDNIKEIQDDALINVPEPPMNANEDTSDDDSDDDDDEDAAAASDDDDDDDDDEGTGSTTDDTGTDSSPKTGDGFALGLFLALWLAAAAGIIIIRKKA